MPRYSRAFHSILTKTLKDILLLLPDTVKCHYNQCFRPPFSQKNVDKKGNFSENSGKTKRKSLSTKLLGLFTKTADKHKPEING